MTAVKMESRRVHAFEHISILKKLYLSGYKWINKGRKGLINRAVVVKPHKLLNLVGVVKLNPPPTI